MNILLLVALLVGLSATIALIWLVVRAFKKHPGWGVAVLLLSPFAAIVFGAKYWKDEKTPFLAYISALLPAIALGLYVFAAWGGGNLAQASQQLQQLIQNGELGRTVASGLMRIGPGASAAAEPPPEQEQPGLTRAHPEQQQAANAPESATAEPEPKKIQYDLRSIARKVQPSQERFRLSYIPIQVSDAKNYVGSTVKITRRNVLEKEYRLTGATANSLELAQRNSHGSFSFRFRNSDIEKIRVLTKQPY